MAGSRYVPCVGPSYALANRKAAAQRSINLHLQQIEVGAEPAQYMLASAPGLQRMNTQAVTPRGIYATATRVLLVDGANLAELDETNGVINSPAFVGTLLTSDGFVPMAANQDQLAFSDGDNLYVASLTSFTMSLVTDPYFLGTDWIENIDGYFIFNRPGTDQFYLSNIDDATTGDALDFSSIDAVPDVLITHRVLHHELILFGRVHTEIWVDSGGADFPFQRYSSASIDVGIVGVRAAAKSIDSLFWVGRTNHGTGYVYMMDGHQPLRVSTMAVEEALATSTDISQCSLWSYHTKGSEFVCINAPGMETTWVFDVGLKQWHERAEMVNGEWAPLRIDQVAFADVGLIGFRTGDHPYPFSPPIWGASQPDRSGIYLIDTAFFDLDGAPLVRERTWPHMISSALEPISYRGLELMCNTGQGPSTYMLFSPPANLVFTEGTEGHVSLEISNDGGFTFGTALVRSLGVIGRFAQRIRWLMLGSAKDRVFRVRCSDAVDFSIIGATVDA